MTLTSTAIQPEGPNLDNKTSDVGGNSYPSVIINMPVAASTSIAEGSIVKLSSGYVTNCSARQDVVMGIAKSAADNTDGGAGAINAAVVVWGPAQCDFLVQTLAGGGNDADIDVGQPLFTGGEGTLVSTGQALVSGDGSVTATLNPVGISLVSCNGSSTTGYDKIYSGTVFVTRLGSASLGEMSSSLTPW
jgi:hypothetical protein